VNIWINFVPGSGASILELILRTCTNLDTKPTDVIFGNEKQFVTAHGLNKQFHPKNSFRLKQWPEHVTNTDNVFTPIVPMQDLKGQQVLKYVANLQGVKFYLGPSTDESAEFCAITLQKVPNILEYFQPTKDAHRWSIDALQDWEKREYLSLQFLQWWLPQMKQQWQTAKNTGYICIDTMDFFRHTHDIASKVIASTGAYIVDRKKFNSITHRWHTGQYKIWQDWKNYVQYKQGIKGIQISDNLLHQAMIQYHLRESGIELKCYGLNTFPNSTEIEKYYD
jgi:hypothetical protein